jgi:hypothetical protein
MLDNTNYLKDFVPYKQALALKKLGFDEPCLMAYLGKEKEPYLKCDDTWHLQAKDVLNPLKTPTFSQAFRWFREKYGLKISFPYWNGFNKMIPEDLGRDKYEIMIIPANHRTISVRNPKGRIWFDTYEEAELECLKKLIEITKNK